MLLRWETTAPFSSPLVSLQLEFLAFGFPVVVWELTLLGAMLRRPGPLQPCLGGIAKHCPVMTGVEHSSHQTQTSAAQQATESRVCPQTAALRALERYYRKVAFPCKREPCPKLERVLL